MVTLLFMMRFFKCLTDEHRSKVSEDERLNKGNQYFNHVDEYNKCNE